jgi:hypothetical protein
MIIHFPKNTSFGKLLIVLLLVLLALAQGIYATRSTLTQEYPQTRPHLAKACQWLKCEIALAHDVKQLSIEDTALTQSKIRTDVIKLSGTLTNHAAYAQAYPDLELSLTDANDIVVLRRYLKASEYTENPSKGIAANTDVSFNVGLLLDGVEVTGYHIKMVNPNN